MMGPTMINTYKDQFTEWSPAYPVVFHSNNCEFNYWKAREIDFLTTQTLETHSVTIKTINKAMKE